MAKPRRKGRPAVGRVSSRESVRWPWPDDSAGARGGDCARAGDRNRSIAGVGGSRPGAIAHNIQAIRARLAPSARLMAVVKQTPMGMAWCRCARLLEGGCERGAWRLSARAWRCGWVGSAPDPRAGRSHGGEVADAAAHQLSISITSQEMAQLILDRPQRLPTGVHLKVDTGMTRLGMFPREVPALLDRLVTKGVSVVGCYTQLASADHADHAMTSEQLARFHPVLAVVRARFPRVVVHVANSAGRWHHPTRILTWCGWGSRCTDCIHRRRCGRWPPCVRPCACLVASCGPRASGQAQP